MLYERLTGKKPFDGDNPVSIALKHMQATPKRMTEINPSIPEGLEEITMKAMQKEPSKRYQTAGEMIKDIEEFKKNPSIIFEYKYFSTDGSTKYFDKVSPEQTAAVPTAKRKVQLEAPEDDEEYDDDDDYYDDEDEYYERRRRSPVLPILFALATAFVIMTAWLIHTIVTKNFDDIQSASGEEVTMPTLVNLTWDEVRAQYNDYNFIPVTQYSSEYEKNVVMDQSVMPGRTIKKNQEVEVVVSNGPKLVEIDDYSNKHIDDVVTMLKKQDLKYEIIRTESDDVAADFVIKTSPAAREFVEAGTTVTCYVSLGKSNESTAVPNMVNLSLASAKMRAEEYDILLTILYEPSTEVEEGRVIRQSIEPTTLVEKNTMVEIVVSDGSEPVKDAQISISMSSNATGEFEFRYYIDGTLQEDMTEIKDIGLTDKIIWNFSGSGVHEYAIRVTSLDTGASGTLLVMEVDFTTDPVTKDDHGTFNKKLFKQLLTAQTVDNSMQTPAETDDTLGGENWGGGIPAVTTDITDTAQPDEVTSEPFPSIEVEPLVPEE